MISGGPTVARTIRNSQKAYAREVMSIVGEPFKHSNSEMTLEFGDPYLEGLKFPQDDPLVIMPIIGNCPIMRVLVDNGASVNIFFHDTILRMGYNDSQLTPSDVPIYGFNQVEFQVEREIQLPLTIGEEPREATQILNFQVIKEASTYNAIMGRTWIHAFKAVPSTYHMVLKFPTRTESERQNEIIKWPQLLSDIPGIDPDLINHKLNADPTRKAVKQKKKDYAPCRLKAIKQEVKKLPEAGFIKKVQFLEWLANPVMRLVNKIFTHLIGKTMEVYVDDMLVKILSKADYINHLREAFEVLRHHKMMLNPAKSAFGVGSGNFEWTTESQEAFKKLKKYTAEAPLLAKPSLEDILYLYRAVSEQAVSAAAVKKEHKL
ncbi:uncharacterized protein LOC141714212 [Apium graveolens]|uniref:uncharacterized protein LOC141714212 n=1 Tax=Apium graveolens TaxID=4045 RepID=UPI003D795F85